ncbi:ROK family transcriptional regulator [Phytoactinopolyspora halotolerans]|uniref:ROK family transcriptional regulator n=1 Tax=Phytoactinopolyspora halotolerans TaxID=1981512 RepID=A0A6L9S5D4_9ACTN|nr:ROK family transcriptional regulator [Phytoactinopolyspora halotolerans]NEE00665.1 ROK family transcriptional regulator [Phytoactinopolyspora halotolerans]
MRIEQGSTHEAVRRHNLSVVLRQLHLAGPLSRSELAMRTDLNRSTIKALVAQLGSLGLVRESDADHRGTRGRPSPMVAVRSGRLVVLAVEIAVDFVTVATVGLGGRIHAEQRIDLAHGAAVRPAVLVRQVRDVAAELVRPSQVIMGVGVAIVGLVRGEDGFVHIAPNLGWADVPLGQLVADELRVPTAVAGGSRAVIGPDVPVLVANEADLGVLAEHARGAAQGFDNVLYLSGEVGIGGGVVVGGRRLTGANGYAGELGHLPVNPDGRACGCGGRGCWETEAGKRTFLRLAGHEQSERPEQPTDPVAHVVAAAKAGDPQAVRAAEEVGRWLGIGLAGLVNVFDPDRVVLGGMYGRAFDVFEAAVVEVLKTRALTPPTVELVPAALGPESSLIGAAELAFEPLLADPDGVLTASLSARDGAASARVESSPAPRTKGKRDG